MLVTGPYSVGKGAFTENLKNELADIGRKAKVLHIDERDPLDVLRLINGAVLGRTNVEIHYSGDNDKSIYLEDDELLLCGRA